MLDGRMFKIASDTRIELRRCCYEQVWNEDHTSFRSRYLGDVRYAVEYVDEGHMRFVRGVQSKVVCVKPDHEFVYQAQKTQIRARGAANGLFEHCKDDLWHSCTMALADHAIDVMRPAKGYGHEFLGKAA